MNCKQIRTLIEKRAKKGRLSDTDERKLGEHLSKCGKHGGVGESLGRCYHVGPRLKLD